MGKLVFPVFADIAELLPAAGAALSIVIAGVVAGRRRGPRWTAAACVVAVAVAFAGTYVRMNGVPAFPPHGSTGRGLIGVVLAAGLGLVSLLVTAESLRRFALQIAGAAGVVLLVAGGLSSNVIAPLSVAAVLVSAVAYTVLLDIASFVRTPVFTFGYVAAMAGTAQVFLMFGGALFAQIAATLALTVLCVGALLAMIEHRIPPVMALPLAAATITLSFDASLTFSHPPPYASLVLLALGPVAPIVAYTVPPARLGRAGRAMLGIALSLATTIAGFTIAYRVAPEAYR